MSDPNSNNQGESTQNDTNRSALSAAEEELKAAREALEAAERNLAAAQATSETQAQVSSVPEGNVASPTEPPASAPTPEAFGVGASGGTQTTGSQQQPFSGAAPSGVGSAPGEQVPPPYSGYTSSQNTYGTQSQPYQTQPHYTAPYASSKDHVAAGLLAIFLGCFGIHKFYLGYNTQGFIMLAISILAGIFTFGMAAGVMWIISVIEGILYLTKSQTEFERIYVYGKREWF